MTSDVAKLCHEVTLTMAKLCAERDELLTSLRGLVSESTVMEALYKDERPVGWEAPALGRARRLLALLNQGG